VAIELGRARDTPRAKVLHGALVQKEKRSSREGLCDGRNQLLRRRGIPNEVSLEIRERERPIVNLLEQEAEREGICLEMRFRGARTMTADASCPTGGLAGADPRRKTLRPRASGAIASRRKAHNEVPDSLDHPVDLLMHDVLVPSVRAFGALAIPTG
jgi:hypothetical protein